MGVEFRGGGIEQKGKGLMDVDCSVVVTGGWGGIRGLNAHGKNIIKIKLKKFMPWVVWISGLSTGLRSKGLPVKFPVKAHAWVSGHFLIVGA